MATLIKIGNSKGIRIPQPIIKQANLENAEIEFVVTKEGLLLKPIKQKNRLNWKENIEEVLAKNKDKKDKGIVEEFLNETFEDWEW
ncbi:antitoxin MazE [Nitratiruptor sp. YY08-26]|uniref:AbrB/MazE/SpoVT family DNA-binding domain-containing protein n=1 Tax=unclassified Nitratiruptor TaxID=2624044 RepID=UPI001915FEB0|nr:MULTISPECIES: AbrB/MazE/SpoVT family DNA-binding domain-containing protein [unclassified Nitratiruptor]BCD61632.1 antitoxin MazE [Nitratiruptor sp. YY08-13]BCD65567.1 antitoxin MazE [Nitratiruptor sp. YY08-26]